MDFPAIVLKEVELRQLFLSIFSLLVSAHFFGYIFNKCSLPRVIGEILGGIILGPSCFGFIFPEYCNKLFNFFPEQGKILSFLYWIGLALLMLSAGFKVNHTSGFKEKKLLFVLIISSTLLPILGGWSYYKFYDFTPYRGHLANDLSMSIVVCVSIAITSIPIISKIFIDLNIINSQFAKIVLAAAIFHDLILWVALDVAINNTVRENSNLFIVTFITILFLVFSLLVGPYLINYVTKLRGNLLLKSSSIGYLISVCLFIIIIANCLNVNIVFGALMAGVIICTLPNAEFQFTRDLISEFSLAFFIPIYFAIVGLKINLPSYFDLKLFLSFLLVSSLLEIGSVFIGIRLLKKNCLTSLNFGFAMNTRGGPGIVIASLAYEFSIINQIFFVVLILVAIVTSLISGIWFKFILNRNWSLYENSS
ncbi:MAG TPA: cation:proton antiporter [Rickettsia endosymbiont of Sericostoma sp. HW-2014]|nr:cation:proton antiporter [Rickettsia endosymbiont of Sericostoma sp. HW-2014]